MIRPAVLQPQPSMLLTLVGGLVATLLVSALLFLAPVFGFPFIDVPRLVGGILTADPTVAFWLGFWVFFLAGVLCVAPPLALSWAFLPGSNTGFIGALVKGLLWGLILFVVGGLLVPVCGGLNQLPDHGLRHPGLFALGAGRLGPVGMLLGHLAYGLALALVAAMGQGIKPLDTLGWQGHGPGDTRAVALSPAAR